MEEEITQEGKGWTAQKNATLEKPTRLRCPAKSSFTDHAHSRRGARQMPSCCVMKLSRLWLF